MRALVIGGCGFLGGAVALELKRRGYDVIVFDKSVELEIEGIFYIKGDITDLSSLRQAMTDVDEVYHYAGELGTAELFETPYAAVNVNITGTLNILNASLESKVKRTMYCAMPSIWLNIYSITKKAASDICLAYKKNFGLDVRVMRVFNAYGPGQHLFPVRKIVPIFILQATHNLALEIWGNGEQYVDLVYSEDAARVVVDNMQLEHMENMVLDIDAACHVKVKDVAAQIIRLTDSKSHFRRLPMRDGEDETTYDLKINRNFGSYTTELDMGLLKTVSYFRDLPKKTLKDAIAFYYGHSDASASDLTIQARKQLQIEERAKWL